MRPEVSIVLPVRNAEATVGEAIESCLGQTMGDFELLFVVNGCTDGTCGIVDEFAGADSRVRSIESEAACGVAGAMQAGIAAARAPFLMRMDADDVSHSRRIEAQVAMLTADESLAAVTCGVRLIDSLGDGMQRYVDWVNGLATPEDVARERFIECPVIQPSLMMWREGVEAAGGYRDCGWAEDHDLFLRMLELGKRFGKVPETLLDWRDSATRLTRTHEAYAEENVWRMKAHYLWRLPEVRERGVAICGAGPIGKRLARELGNLDVKVKGFFEVNPRRIGERIGGVVVAGPEEFGTRWREAVLLGAVGVEGGRERVRRLADEADYTEGEDFWCCC